MEEYFMSDKKFKGKIKCVHGTEKPPFKLNDMY